MPSMPGISTSKSITCGGAASRRYSKTELPFTNVLGSVPVRSSRTAQSTARILGSSSTTAHVYIRPVLCQWALLAGENR